MALVAIGAATPLSAAPSPRVQINEFLAGNNLGIEDADGDPNDWLELYNADAASVNLAGWFLTDDPAYLTKWAFPATNLNAGAYLVVFASGKNRAIPGVELHTSFQLQSESGFLALVRPDLTIASSFNYPAQKSDVSFGPSHATVPLVSAGTPIKWFVPANGSLGTNWTGGNEPFNDASWSGGISGIGYLGTGVAAGSYSNLVRGDAALVAYWRLDEMSGAAVADATGAHSGTLSSGYARNRAGALNGDTNPSTDFSGGRVTVPASAALNFAGSALTVEAWVQPDGSGNFAWLVAKESDNSSLDYLLGLNPDGRFRFITQGLANDVVAPNVPVLDGAHWYHVVGVQDPAANRVSLYVNGALAASVPRAASGVTSANPLLIGDRSEGGQTVNGRIDEVAVYGRAFSANEVLLHYQTGTNSSSAFAGLIGTNIQSALQGVNSSAYLRIPLVVTNVNALVALTLRLYHDDGFVAYLNGVEVARRNAPAAPAWNSAATTARAGEALLPETFDLGGLISVLHSGTNVLAIHGLNVAAADDDFLILPQLEASLVFSDQPQFFRPPTPGAPNGQAYPGWVADTRFSINRGFFNAPINVAISCATSNAIIRYTTNCSEPDATHGLIYAGPVHITTTAALRAAAFFPGFIPSDVDTHTYLFTNDIIHQPANPPGFPALWAGSAADYAMDQNVVNLAQTYSVHAALRSIPTLSITTDTDNIFGAASGIYVNSLESGELWERPASAELINPDSTTAFQLNCGLRLQGGYSREPSYTPKHSFRLLFKSEYGASKLRHPLFPDSPIRRFDGITLRAFYTDAWIANRLAPDRFRPEDAQYQRDVWMKDTQLAMGQLSAHNIYCHLYINGLFWGLYNIGERTDAAFNAAYRGGAKEDYDVLKDYQEIQNGDNVAFNAMFAIANRPLADARSVSNPLGYADLAQYLDIPGLIDYMILHIYAGAEDWPTHNWYCGRRRAAGAQFKFYAWDQEIGLDSLTRDRSNVNDPGTPAGLYAQLRQNPEFRVLIGDRVQRHLFNNGALTPTNNIARYLARAAQINQAVVAESARWGDVRRTPAFNRDGDWLGVQQWEVTNFFPNIHALALQRFIAAGLYPALGAPAFSQFGGAVPAGFALAITHTNASGTILFTLDGSDPRAAVTGAVAPGAQAYSAPVPLNAPTPVRARVLTSGQWSALVEAMFYPPQDLSKLALTEIMYRPPDVGATNGDEFEFLELKNTGTNALDLSGLTFPAGISFTFTNGTVLGPGQFCVLARNAAAFASKYPGVTLGGIYTGKLDNGGETLSLAHALGTKIFALAYADLAPWPATPDGYGWSLVPKSPELTQAPDQGEKWRASTLVGGSPGADDPAPALPAIVIHEILTHTDLPDRDSIELFNPTATDASLGGWFLSDDAAQPKKYRIPNGTTLPAGGFVVFDDSQFNPAPGTYPSFSLNSQGESVYLFSGDANTNLTGYSHGFAFGPAANGVSFGRHLNSVGEEQFPAQLARTLGAANSGPRVGPVVISEIHYHPAPGGDAFVELKNITSGSVPWFDPAFPTNTWKLNGIGFTFPTNLTLPAGGWLLLVATNPAAFAAKYSVPTHTLILGPWSGALQPNGERLSLERPDAPDTNGVFYIVVDTVRYGNQAPWPAAADGSGPSLQRRFPAQYGDDPANWIAADATPGREISAVDTDGDGLPDDWEIANGTNPNAKDASADPDGDGFTNLQEYLAGTHPHDPDSRLSFTSIAVAGQGATLRFLAASNHSYTVLYSPVLDPAGWLELTNVAASPISLPVTVTDSTHGPGIRFYRLVTPARP